MNNILLILLFACIIVFVAIFPNKTIKYSGNNATRFVCGISALISIFAIILIDLINNNQAYKHFAIVFVQVSSILMLFCSVLCYRRLLLHRNQGILFKLSAILSFILLLIGVLWIVLYWLKIIEFDIYLFMAPSIGSILLSSYGIRDK